MQRFKQVLEDRHDYARDWKKRTGGKVLGYFEPYTPEEVIYAAGVLPVRLLSRHEPDDRTDRNIYASCACARDIVNQVAMGRFDYVDGTTYAEACQWMRHAFISSQYFQSFSYTCDIFVPDYVDGHRSRDVMLSELKAFKKSLEEWTGNEVTDEALDHAIEVYNINRRLMRQVYELRRAQAPVISGSEAMNMVLAGQVMDKEDHNRLLTEFLDELPSKDLRGYPGPRLMLIGSPTSDADLEKLVEDLGACVVIDELCTGSGYFWNEVIPQPDRLLAISLRYLGKPHCALKDNNWRRRPQHIHQLYEDWNAQGVIIAKQIYCHPHGTDNPHMWTILREKNYPFHFLERDTTLPVREMKTRLQAFIDMVEPVRVKLEG
ncbi:MAG: 2-hydroxyacyl-CoA dehydratase [Dehalococcoidales bacterium]|nr:2-hydroxyacyl-CoA dehydratase [Dehalococcoidales bacterium]